MFEAIGNCGKKLKWYCTPDIEDDLCAGCPWNTNNQPEIEEVDQMAWAICIECGKEKHWGACREIRLKDFRCECGGKLRKRVEADLDKPSLPPNPKGSGILATFL